MRMIEWAGARARKTIAFVVALVPVFTFIQARMDIYNANKPNLVFEEVTNLSQEEKAAAFERRKWLETEKVGTDELRVRLKSEGIDKETIRLLTINNVLLEMLFCMGSSIVGDQLKVERGFSVVRFRVEDHPVQGIRMTSCVISYKDGRKVQHKTSDERMQLDIPAGGDLSIIISEIYQDASDTLCHKDYLVLMPELQANYAMIEMEVILYSYQREYAITLQMSMEANGFTVKIY